MSQDYFTEVEFYPVESLVIQPERNFAHEMRRFYRARRIIQRGVILPLAILGFHLSNIP
jgi:hypothetical protein